MKSKIIILTALAALTSVTSSCVTRGRTVYDNSKLTTYDVNLSNDFDAISVANNIEVDYTVSDKVKLTISTPSDNKGNIVAEVQGSTLVLECETKKRTFNSPKIKVTISAPAIQTIIARNNAEISVSGTYNANALSITATNNAEIEFGGKVTTSKCEFIVTNNAEISFINLKSDNVTTTVTNNAEFTVKDLDANSVVATATNNAEIDLTGTADVATLTATNNAELNAGKLKVSHATCTAHNLAQIFTNADKITSETRNQGSVKNKR